MRTAFLLGAVAFVMAVPLIAKSQTEDLTWEKYHFDTCKSQLSTDQISEFNSLPIQPIRYRENWLATYCQAVKLSTQERYRFDGCRAVLTTNDSIDFFTLPEQARLSWLNLFCPGTTYTEKKKKMYLSCRDSLTPNQRFRLLLRPVEALAPWYDKPQCPIQSSAPTKRKTIAIAPIANCGDLQQADIAFLSAIMQSSFEELPQDRFSVHTLATSLDDCDGQPEDAASAAWFQWPKDDYVITGRVSKLSDGNGVLFRLLDGKTGQALSITARSTPGSSGVDGLVDSVRSVVRELRNNEAFLNHTPQPSPVAANPPQRQIYVAPPPQYPPLSELLRTKSNMRVIGYRIAGHVLFWPGLVMTITGLVLGAAADWSNVPLWSPLVAIGGGFTIIGMSTGLYFLSHKDEVRVLVLH